MEEYEFKEFAIDGRRSLVSQLNEWGKEGWHNPFKPYDTFSIILQRKVKGLDSSIPDDSNPQLLSEDRPAQQVTQ